MTCSRIKKLQHESSNATSEKGLELLKKIDSGLCDAHIGTRALAAKE
jgi:hypothetical protein